MANHCIRAGPGAALHLRNGGSSTVAHNCGPGCRGGHEPWSGFSPGKPYSGGVNTAMALLTAGARLALR